jgi:hypothetical protein
MQSKFKNISLNIIRSDYMIDSKKNANLKTSLSQIEINTFACGGVADSSYFYDLYK